MADNDNIQTIPQDANQLIAQDPVNPLAGTPFPQEALDFIAPAMQEEKYGTVGQQLKTAAEGAAQGVIGPFAPMAERALGVKPEDILARQAVNPISHGLGEAAGLTGSMLIGTGEGALVAKVGAKVAEATGISSRIGSAAVKAAVENLGISSSDEMTKTVLGDSNQTAGMAALDIGLSGVLGGAFGGAQALWKSTQGAQTGSILKAIANKAGGIDGVAPDAMNDAIETSGMNISPEVKAAFSSDPAVQHMFQTLQESATGSGLKAQEALKSFKSDLGDQVVRALGKSPEDVSSIADMSDYEAGAAVKKTLIDNLKANNDPISSAYEGIKAKFKNTPLTASDTGDIATKIGEMSTTEGFNLSPSSPQSKLISRVLEEIPNLKTLEDVRKYSSVVGDTTNNPDMWRLGSKLRQIFRGSEESALDNALGEKAPELIGEHQAAKAAYKTSMDAIEDLNDRLHVGRYNGPGSFIKALNEMAPEDVIRRLSPKGDAGIIGELSGRFPQVADQIKDYHLNQVLKGAASKAAPGETINPKALFTSMSKLSPEMRNFLMPEAVSNKVNAFQSLLEGLPSKMNNSGTAKTLDALMSHIPGSAIGLLTAAAGHGVGGFLLAPLVKALGRDIPDAIRLGTLKFLGSSKPIDTVGFKAMTDYIHSAVRGLSMLNRSTAAIFQPGKEILSQSFMPTENERAKLDKYLKAVQQDPMALTKVGSTPGSYMPDHGQALSQTAMQASNYLNKLRPVPLQHSPLDTKTKPSAMDKATYNRALDVAQQPLVVLHRVSNGTLVPADVEAIKTMYPALYQAMNGKLNQQVIDAVSKGQTIPYKTRLSLSLLMGTHLDSTLDPQAVMAAQSVGKGPQGPEDAAQAPQQPMGAPKTKGSTKALSKFSNSYRTPSQVSEQRRSAGKE